MTAQRNPDFLPGAEHESGFVSGFVSILGRPNAGKSTLLNRLTGAKLAIVADKPQTTRNRIQGVVNQPGAQVVFLDTPGIHKPDTRMNRRMMAEVREALQGCDLLLLMVDATQDFGAGDEFALELLRRANTPTMLALNKVDALSDKQKLLPQIDRYRQLHEFTAMIPISARTGEGADALLQAIIGQMPQGPRYFPEDHLTDQPARFLAAEIIREKLIRLTRQEVPHSVLVLLDKFEELPRLLRLYATILVERDGQKKILIGRRGEMMKKIGIEAREELEKIFGQKVFLQLFVKVREGWRESEQFLAATDWRSQL